MLEPAQVGLEMEQRVVADQLVRDVTGGLALRQVAHQAQVLGALRVEQLIGAPPGQQGEHDLRVQDALQVRLRRLGLRTLGDLAALPLDSVQDRFGRYGVRIWRSARGESPTRMTPRTPPPDLTAEISFEPPLDSVEAICFSVRTTAERLVTDLAARL